MALLESLRALAISQGDAALFITHPISPPILALSFLLFIAPLIVRALRRD